LFGPGVKSVVLSLLVIPVVLFAVFMSKELVTEFQQPLGNLIITMAGIFAALCKFVSSFYAVHLYWLEHCISLQKCYFATLNNVRFDSLLSLFDAIDSFCSFFFSNLTSYR